eukprot:513115-Pleurochrysis_carterae.AAC.2
MSKACNGWHQPGCAGANTLVRKHTQNKGMKSRDDTQAHTGQGHEIAREKSSREKARRLQVAQVEHAAAPECGLVLVAHKGAELRLEHARRVAARA